MAPLRRVLLIECGVGDGLAALAAALAGTGAEVIGAAGDPEEAAAARALIRAAGLEARVIDAAPEALAARADLPTLDLVAFPWGWDRLGAPARGGVAALLARRLASGGAFLLMQEALPGALDRLSLRRLLRHAWLAAGGDAGPRPENAPGAADRLPAALALAERMLAESHALVRLLIDWAPWLAMLRSLPPATALRDWIAPDGPRWTLPETLTALAPAGLTQQAPADLPAALPELDRTPAQRALIAAAPDAALAAEAESLMLGPPRRADLFVKPGGPAPADPATLRFVRTATPWSPPIQPPQLSGRLSLDEAAYAPLAEAAEAAGAPATAAALGNAAGLGGEEAARRAAVLSAAGILAPAHWPAPGDEARAAAGRLNALLLAAGRGCEFAAPAAGGALSLGLAETRAWRAGAPPALAAALARLGAGPAA